MIKKAKLKCPTCKLVYYVVNSRENTAKYCSRECVRVSDGARAKMSAFHKQQVRSKEWSKKIGLSRLAEKNPLWKGNEAGLDAIHVWVTARFKKPKFCTDCLKSPPKDLANISQKYKRDLDDWEWLCRRCHMTKDGRIAQLKARNRLKKLTD